MRSYLSKKEGGKGCIGGKPTSYTHGRPHVDFDGGFFGDFIAALDFDGRVDGAEDGVAVLGIVR